MASAGGNILPPDIAPKYLLAGIAGVGLFVVGLSKLYTECGSDDKSNEGPGLLKALALFCYTCFVKPHAPSGTGNSSQQDHLESFYATQATIYDKTRKALLHGREDMLALVAAQLQFKASNGRDGQGQKKRVWVDVGGGTGWNIEAMAEFVNVPEFFSQVYLVDFSPSLCSVAKKRFERLGWKNVRVVCEDARKFRLEDYENDPQDVKSLTRSPSLSYFSQNRAEHGGADLITMSYSLSMMPDYFSIVDSVGSLLSPEGVMGVVDFYVQSKVDYSFRNYTGGILGRHVTFLPRAFWRAWFDLDRVSLEPSRRDYLEYRFGTVLSVNGRNNSLGSIPYYVWLGCHKKPFSSSSLPHEIIERIDALATESPLLLPATQSQTSAACNVLTRAVERTAPEMRSKAFDAAVQNISSQLPLPSFFYQNHHWRIYYDDQLPKHTQFKDEYIYAFTWEDARVDERILKLGPDDVVLAITSAGDNILSYARQSPARIHAVDLNPTQNHLLELKVAAYAAGLPYDDFWQIFGEGKHPRFRSLLVSRLSPHLSSRAFQYWLARAGVFTSRRGRGLYDTGGSRHAIRIFRWVARFFGVGAAVRDVLAAKTLNEQRDVWRDRLAPALLSRLVSSLVVSSEAFLWAALGVPKNQLAMIEADHRARIAAAAAAAASSSSSSSSPKKSPAPKPALKPSRAAAVWRYMVDTLDPVAQHTHIAADNPYYRVCLAGSFSPRCHPDYLSAAAHRALGRPGALDGLRIHTDEMEQVLARLRPGSLTVAVVMDSMDWFDPGPAGAAARQVALLNRALAVGGRVLLRSAAREPWYLGLFKEGGFAARLQGSRGDGGECIDRVNMYASCWVCTKVGHLPPQTPPSEGGVGIGGEVEGEAGLGEWNLETAGGGE